MGWMRRFRRNWQICQSAALTAAVFVIGFMAGSMTTFDKMGAAALDAADEAFEPFWEAFSIVESRYVDAVDIETLVDGAIDGMVASLNDEHSGYIHQPELCEKMTDFSGRFSGIGVMIRTMPKTGETVVVSVIPNSPAEDAGVMAGDVFHEVDGESAVGMTQAELTAIVPGPRGAAVNITFRRGDELVDYDIVRDIFTVPNVSHQMVGDHIAHVTMLGFNEVSRSQLDDALKAIDINSSNGLIFDIRGNPGGTLSSAIEVGSAFIEEGVLLRQVSRDQSEEVTRASGGHAKIAVPVVVLVDETSASASEVIAGAMQDYGAATIIGETTFGKGTVQNIPELSNDGCVRITVKRWLRPNGAWIHQQGIQPDIIVEWDLESDGDLEDPQLAEAIRFLESLRRETARQRMK